MRAARRPPEQQGWRGMGGDYGELRPRMVEAIATSIWGGDWRPPLAALLGVELNDGTTPRSRTGPLGMLTPAAETALLLRLVLAELATGRIHPADGMLAEGARGEPDTDSFVSALKRALGCEQRTGRHVQDPEGVILRALLRASAATGLTGDDVDGMVRAARPSPASERQIRAATAGLGSVHEAASAVVRLWNRELTRHRGSFTKDGGSILHQALEEVGRAEMRPLPEIAERLGWYAAAYDLLHRCDDEDTWRWLYEQLAEGGRPADIEAQLGCMEAHPIAPAG